MTFKTLSETIISNVLNPLVGIIITLALIYFLWGVAKYVGSPGSEEKRREAISVITHGLIALFVMVSVWGLVKVLQNTFELDNRPTQVPIPASPADPIAP